LCLQCCCDVRAFTRSTPVCNCEIETRREKARAKEIACAVILQRASACVPLSVCLSVCTDAMIHSQRSLAVYLLVNCMSVSDMLVSPCTHPAGSCAPFSWVTLAIQMSWISPAPVFARSLRSRWSCDCDRQESEWYNYQRSRFGKGSLSHNQSRGYRELGTGDCEYMCTFMFLCTYLPNPFMRFIVCRKLRSIIYQCRPCKQATSVSLSRFGFPFPLVFFPFGPFAYLQDINTL